VRGSAYGAIRAFDPRTDERKWEFRVNDAQFISGVLTTASRLVFTGVVGDNFSDPQASRLANGYFYALHADTGQLLWKMSPAAGVTGSPISYSAGGNQYVAVAAGHTLFALALRR
jgi:alcohol dehydrogenase (cytochrome c)